MLYQVVPDVSQRARATITGKVRINVKLQVDTGGNVVAANVENDDASKYFADQAARGLKALAVYAAGSRRSCGSQRMAVAVRIFTDRDEGISFANQSIDYGAVAMTSTRIPNLHALHRQDDAKLRFSAHHARVALRGFA